MENTLFIISIGTVVLLTSSVLFLVMVLRKDKKHMRDVQKIRQELENLNDVLQKKDSTKNEFLSFATHQLRSPLTSIKWGLSSIKETLVDCHADVETTKIVDHLLMTTDDLISTVSDLLDISKIEQGGLVLKKESFDVHDMVVRITEEFKMTAFKKELALNYSGSDQPVVIMGDQTKIRQVIVNLLDNAIKYTKSGSVTISLNQQSKMIHIKVTDTGVGISKEEQHQLFDKFIRGAAGKASQGGSGLGLFLAKKIVELHHGKISVASEGVGRGSVFTVELPVDN